MKTLFSLLAFTVLFTVSAQNGFGVKGGLTYNADQGLIKTANSTFEAKGDGSIGYHLGVYKRLNLTGIYIQPELVYVNYKNSFEDAQSRDIDVEYKRFDIPVSIGTDVLGIGYIQGGPVLSYYFKDKIDYDQVSQVKQDELALGLQVGAGVQLQQFNVGLRYDFPMGERTTEWVQNNSYEFQTESTPKLLHLSVGYSF